MQSTELLHRFFDEGLDESLEDVLFERMAVDAELRREFLQHQKLHTVIQEDVAGITTPSHVSQQLFINLGLTPPANISVDRSGIGKRVGAALVGIGGAFVRGRKYVFTAAISAMITALFFISTSREETRTESGHLTTRPPAAEHGIQVTPQRDMQDEGGVRGISATAVPSSLRFSSGASEAPTSLPDHGSARPAPGAVAQAGMTSVLPTGSTAGTATQNTDPLLAMQSAFPPYHALQSAVDADSRDGESILRDMVMRADPVSLLEPSTERPWHFFRPGPRTNLLSNLVFELRKLYGQSYPSVDLPHYSHTLFENMAISTIYKVTEHHAFGFEYGRENFGREFTAGAAPTLAPLDVSMQQLYTPPAPAMTETVRENRMVDIFGAVWKLSLPEYGMFRAVYPYMRTFVGASLLGPISKVRVGLEMYPSNFSMLNVGVEGGLLRYTVDETTYYTSKLNFTVGVAIGF